MCNAYRIQPKRSEAAALAGKVSEAARDLVRSLVRKSDPGLVILGGGEIATMRWGFQRSFNPSINNTRADKLDSAIWREAFLERRCVIPMDWFYEWSDAPGGRKQAHELHPTDAPYLWAAGIWEENADHGRCFSMVTTSACGPIASIHDRMPFLMPEDCIPTYLENPDLRLLPPSSPLLSAPLACASPLARPSPPSAQQELF